MDRLVRRFGAAAAGSPSAAMTALAVLRVVRRFGAGASAGSASGAAVSVFVALRDVRRLGAGASAGAVPPAAAETASPVMSASTASS